MKFFKAFSDEFKVERTRTKQESLHSSAQLPLKVISSGRILEIQILEKKPEIAKLYTSKIETLARVLEKEGVKHSKSADGTMKLEYPNAKVAEDARKIFADFM